MSSGSTDVSAEVSVVVATYGRPETLARTLDSLAAQTLDRDRFEVVVVPNGPAEGTAAAVALVREHAAAHPDLRLRTVVTDVAGVAHARSVGVAAARGTWMTMVDDDDWVSPAYLERLADAAEPGIIPLVDVADVVDGGEPSFDNSYSEHFRRFRGRVVPAATLPKAMSFNVCKTVPTRTAREVGFDERLRSASDTIFWLGVAERTRALLHVLDVDDAVYYRTTETGSLSRQDTTYDFSVSRRLEGYRALAEIPENDGETAAALLFRTRGSLARHLNDYLLVHPGEHATVHADARRRGLRNVAWRRVNRRLATEVVVTGDLTRPDPAALSGRGIVARGAVVDVVGTVDWLDQRGVPPDLSRPFVVPVECVVVDARSDPWRRAVALAAEVETLREFRAEEQVGPHTAVRSTQAEWLDPVEGVPHLAAAAYVARRPATWIVEVAAFPGDLDAHPYADPHDAHADLAPWLDGMVASPDAGLGAGLGATAWSLVLSRADRIVFPSAALRDAVLARFADHPAAGRAASVSVVEPFAPVPAWAVEDAGAAQPPSPAPPGVVRLAWVPTGPVEAVLRTLGEVVLGLPPGTRERVRLVVSSAEPDVVRDAARAALVGDLVEVLVPADPPAQVARLAGCDAWLVTDDAEPLVPSPYAADALVTDRAWVLRDAAGALEEVEGRWTGRVDDVAAATAVLQDLLG